MAEPLKKRVQGRPKRIVDPDQIKELAKLGCTWDEIAGVLQIARGTLSARMKEKRYRDAYDQGLAEGETSLRRAQFDGAVGGNTGLLIWLGKTRLGQIEKIETINETTIHDNSSAIDKLVSAVDRLAARGRSDESSSAFNS